MSPTFLFPCGSCYMGTQSHNKVPGSRKICFLHSVTNFYMNVWSWSSCSALEGLDPSPAEDSDEYSIDFSGSENGVIYLCYGSPSVFLSYIKPDSSLYWLGGLTGKNKMLYWDTIFCKFLSKCSVVLWHTCFVHVHIEVWYLYEMQYRLRYVV